MSVARILQAVEIFRSYNVPVTFESGWETRGNGQFSAYMGGIVHHTGGAYNATCPGILIYGRSDLAGPLCNFAGLSGGGIHVVAAHPANHAGASGGPSNGPFPVTSLFNKLVWGLEICYPGGQPMTREQYRTALVFGEVNRRLFGDIELCRGHVETSREGKWDPGYAPGIPISMGVFRSDALNISEDDMGNWDTPITLSTDERDDGRPGVTFSPDVWLKYASFYAGGARESARAAAVDAKAAKDAVAAFRTEVNAKLDRLSTGSGYSLEEIAQAVVAEFKKAGN